MLKLQRAQELANESACPPQFFQAGAGSYWWRSQTSSRKQERSSITMWAEEGRRAWCWPDPALILCCPPLMAGASGQQKTVSSLGETAPLKGYHGRLERYLVLISALIRKFRRHLFSLPWLLNLIASNFSYFSALRPLESFSLYANLYLLCFTMVYDEKLAPDMGSMHRKYCWLITGF